MLTIHSWPSIAPSNPESALRPGRIIRDGLEHLAQGNAEQALECFDLALTHSRDPGDPLIYDAIMGRAEALIKLGRTDESMMIYQAMHQLHPGFAQPLRKWALLLRHLGRHEESLEKIDQALHCAPGSIDLLAQRAICLGTLSRLEEAVDTLKQALDQSPEAPDLIIRLGSLLCLQGRFEEAAASFRQALAQEPDNPLGLIQYGRLLAHQGAHEQALQHFESAEQRLPNESDLYLRKAHSLAKLNRFDQAHQEIDRAQALRPNNARIPLARGQLFLEQQRFEDALEAYRKAETLGPIRVETLHNTAFAQAQLGQLEAALSTLERARTYPSHQDTTETLADSIKQAIERRDRPLSAEPAATPRRSRRLAAFASASEAPRADTPSAKRLKSAA